MAFLEDPRLRQRWNQITHDAEAATENAAAGIWSFQHHYINPCFASIVDSIDHCTTACISDPEERQRKRRERERATEYSFDFYDDWYEDEANGGLLGSWSNEDWDRLLAGTGSQKRHPGGETSEQPRRKRGMSYGTRSGRRKTSENDPTIIPSTQPIGFLSKLPWKMGGTLRYKPSAADLQEHPGRHEEGEVEPLLGHDDDYIHQMPKTRNRSGTTGSGDTSDSYRSRGDLFPSDGEGEEDAVALDDEITYEMLRKDDRSGGRSRTRSSKGKRPASGFGVSRTVSRTTLGSVASRDSLKQDRKSSSHTTTPDIEDIPSIHELEMEEHALQQVEDEEVARKKEAASLLAAERGLAGGSPRPEVIAELKPVVAEDEVYQPEIPQTIPTETAEAIEADGADQPDQPTEPAVAQSKHEPETKSIVEQAKRIETNSFVPARLPNFR